MDAQTPHAQAGIWPVTLAIGISVLLVGLVISPLAIAPLGAAIALGAPAPPKRQTAARSELRREYEGLGFRELCAAFEAFL